MALIGLPTAARRSKGTTMGELVMLDAWRRSCRNCLWHDDAQRACRRPTGRKSNGRSDRMDRKRALKLARAWAQGHVCTLRHGEAQEYHELFISLLEELPPNEPLTLEQLRQMDGEPVYIPETNCWVLVTKNPFVPLFTWPDREQCSAYDWYEQVGPAYRRPQEESTNE